MRNQTIYRRLWAGEIDAERLGGTWFIPKQRFLDPFGRQGHRDDATIPAEGGLGDQGLALQTPCPLVNVDEDLTPAAVRRYLDVGAQKVYALLNCGELKATRTGRHWRINSKAFFDRFGWPDGSDPGCDAIEPAAADRLDRAARCASAHSEGYLTAEAVRRYLRMSVVSFADLLDSGALPTRRVGREWRIARDAFFQQFDRSKTSGRGTPSGAIATEAPAEAIASCESPSVERAARILPTGIFCVETLGLERDESTPESYVLAEDKYARSYYSATLSTLEVQKRYPIAVKRLMRAVETGHVKFKREGSSYYFAPAWIEEFLETPCDRKCLQCESDDTAR